MAVDLANSGLFDKDTDWENATKKQFLNKSFWNLHWNEKFSDVPIG